MEVITLWIRVSTPSFTVSADIVNGKLINCAPLISKFNGQPVTNLVRWCKSKFATSTNVNIYREGE